jgi:hypothetical protein
MDKYDIINKIIDDKQHLKIKIGTKKVYLDLQTASILKQVLDAVKPETKEKLLLLDWLKLINIAYKKGCA